MTHCGSLVQGVGNDNGLLLQTWSLGPHKHNVSLLYKQKVMSPKPASPIQLSKKALFFFSIKKIKNLKSSRASD